MLVYYNVPNRTARSLFDITYKKREQKYWILGQFGPTFSPHSDTQQYPQGATQG
jgi:hypothetical protein